ncbi:hypothetical protein SAMN05428982_3280 [Pseudoxanthomonas sp. CF385]|nr:hypothetical protein [Pseudoxanthomonas sp. CF385]SDR13638.1 hypothetical protein SAMN05428982_3280 [Pseudoxanthomonas sp. CF385]
MRHRSVHRHPLLLLFVGLLLACDAIARRLTARRAAAPHLVHPAR